jgi:hypothetical protein
MSSPFATEMNLAPSHTSTTDTNTSPSKASHRGRDLLELAVGYTLILIVIWTPRPWQRWIYFLAAGFILATTWISFPGWGAMGFRTGQFAQSIWLAGVALVIAVAEVYIARRLGTLHAPFGLNAFLHRYWGYVLFACIQQFLLQDFFLLRLIRLFRNPARAAFVAAGVFALAHLPNPILTVATFVWGLTACLFFLWYRNLYPLFLAHSILGIALAVSVPGPVIHNMRVGLSYLTYHAHPGYHRSH